MTAAPTSDATTIWGRDVRAVTTANLLVIALAAFDGLAVVGALPSITEDLGNVGRSPWVLTAYLGVSAVAGLAAGPVIDAIGVRRTFRVTVLWFGLTTGLAGIAPTMDLLIAIRVLQGLGGGLLIAVALASISLAYPASLRPRALAANSVMWGAMGFGGPAVVGVVLAVAPWRWVFFLQVPLVAFAASVGWRRLPTTRERPTRIHTDWAGLAMLTVAVFALLVGGSALGRSWPMATIGLGLSAAGTLAYWRHSRVADEPVVERRHLVARPFGPLHLIVALVLAAGLSDAYLPLYAQGARGWSEASAAFTVVFLTIGWTTAAVTMSRLLDRWTPRFGVAVGASIMPAATAVAAVLLWIDAPMAAVLGAYYCIGLSLGATTNASWSLLQSSTPSEEAGRSNAAHQFVRTTSITAALSLAGAVLLWVVQSQVGDVEVVRDLLAGDEVEVGGDTAGAIADGLATVLSLAVVVGATATALAWREFRRGSAA